MRNELQELIDSVTTKEEMIDLIQSLYFRLVGNRIVDSDSYKASHWGQYPKKTTGTYSYLEARGSDLGYEETIFFGLQYILKKYFATPITAHEVGEAQRLIEPHGEPFNFEGWMHIVKDHGGNLPLRIRAVPEGTVVKLHNVMMTVETTCPKCYWVASYFETALMRVWYPVTVATQSYYIKKTIKHYLDLTADDPENEIAFKLHDFGSRGVSSKESAGIGGLAHLINFMGTDTMHSLEIGRDYYHEPTAGFSIPAGEHSTFSSWGRDGEIDAYRNMLKTFGGKYPLIAVVSDTWNIYNAVGHIWGEELKQEVIDSGSTVVIRPDSGDPVTVLCGLKEENYTKIDGKYYVKYNRNYEPSFYMPETGNEIPEERVKGIIQILAEKFGYTTNSKGFKVLNTVKVLQGDGVNPNSIKLIMETMYKQGWSASNIAFGMGGALLQKVDRDTLKMAYKCSSATIDGKTVDVYKDPITDSGKRSKKGKVNLYIGKTSSNEYGFFTSAVTPDPRGDVYSDAMITYFENGEIFVDETFANIRKRAQLKPKELIISA